MVRFVSATPELIEAHVQAERARHELLAKIREAFATCELLARSLQTFDRRLWDSRDFLRRRGCLTGNLNW
jgi:hypothetical protein